MFSKSCFFLFSFFGLVSLLAASWPNWLGPNFNGALPKVAISIPPAGKDYLMRWDLRVGKGWSSPVVENGLVILHVRENDNEVIYCREFNSGKEKWRFQYKSQYRDDFGMEDGPRSTPAVRKGFVITHSPEGMVYALSFADGKFLWKRDLKKDFSSPKGFFGRCSSPLVIDEKIILDVGGKAGLVALSLRTGSTLWESEPFDNDYSSPVPFFDGEKSLCLSFLREGFIALDTNSGEKKFFYPFRSPIDASVNAASPLVFGNQVFLSSCYGVGAGLWTYHGESKTENFELKWRKKEILDCHYTTPVMHAGFLYGFHGRQERGPTLRCVESRTGIVHWSLSRLGTGNLVIIGDKIIIVSESGELIVLAADPNEAKILHRQQILGANARSHFAIAENHIIARDQRRLICLSLEAFQ